jgi:hypothetical protein
MAPTFTQRQRRSSTALVKYDRAAAAVVEKQRQEDSGRFPLESEAWQMRLRMLRGWRHLARIRQEGNRRDMAIDEDYYDGIQLSEEDLAVMLDRGQPPLIYNVTKNTINWVLGTERKTRIDYRVLPRKKAGTDGAKSKTKILKFIQDMNKGEFERSQAFESAVKAGLGWLELGARRDRNCAVFMRAERWRNMWFDHLGASLDGSDWRFVIREKWVDLDIAQEMFPERRGSLEQMAEAVNSLYPYCPEDITIQDTASEFDLEANLDTMLGGVDSNRPRIKLVEEWYRMPGMVKLLTMRDEDTPYGALDGAIYRADSPEHQYLVRGRYFSLTDSFQMVVRGAMFSGSIYLQDIPSPYNHGMFPFVPMFCYRRQRDNMPYGVVRDIRDPQSDLNKRKSRSLFLLTANRVIADKNAVDDKAEAHAEVNRPDGYVEVNVGKRFEIQKETAEAAHHVEMARDDERFVESITGVTPENKGTLRKDLSGKAIEAIQLQGHTTAGVFFDNYFRAFQAAGEILVSLEEQFFDQEGEYRITGDKTKDEFIRINEPGGPDGRLKNAIQDSKADFIVAKQDYRETLRISMFQMLSELVTSLASSGMGEVALALLDMVVDMMDDLPNKDEIVRRIRKINNQQGPDDDLTPEEKAERDRAMQAAMQEQQAIKGLQMAMLQMDLALKKADVSNKQSAATKNLIEAQMKKLEGYLKAIEAAGAVAQNPMLTESADALIEDAQNLGGAPPVSPRQPLPLPEGGPAV